MAINKENLQELLAAQHYLYGFERCELRKKFDTHCYGAFTVDHVEQWRDQVKTDISKQQVACERHNQEKGSKVMDGRPKVMREYLREIQEKRASNA